MWIKYFWLFTAADFLIVAAFQSTLPIQQRSRRRGNHGYFGPTISPLLAAKRNPSPAKKKSVVFTRKSTPAKVLTHERDFFRQAARLQSMEAYVLVSTLTASMSFGALLGYSPSAASKALVHIQSNTARNLHRTLGLAIQTVSGISTLCGLYATIIFSLTILYGQSALGAERDVEYDVFLRDTTRARVHGFQSFSWSLGLFCLDALLVLVERMFFRPWAFPVFIGASWILLRLYRDWKLLLDAAENIYKE